MSTSDHINRLPINTTQYPTRQDTRVMSTMFGEPTADKPVTMSTTNTSAFKLLAYAGLFVLLNLKIVDDFVRDKIGTSDYAAVGIKTGLFLVVMLVFQLLGW